MTMGEAITQANELRINTMSDEEKKRWLHELDCDMAETMEVDVPYEDMSDDRLLLVQSPHDNIYVYYLVARIDYFNQEIQMYQNDMIMFNEMLANARAYIRRHKKHSFRGNWKI